MSEFRELVGEEFESQMRDLSLLEAGSAEKASAVKAVSELHKMLMEDIRVENEEDEKLAKWTFDREQSELDRELKREQHYDEMSFKREQSEQEQEFNKEEHAYEVESKTKEFLNNNKFQIIRIGVEVGLTVGGWIFFRARYHEGLKFEETGTYTSQHVRNLINKFKIK